jgi:hypothetical protein
VQEGNAMSKELESALALLREIDDSREGRILNPSEAAALLAKIEAADRLARETATASKLCSSNGGCCFKRGADQALAAYRAPQPAGGGE